MPSNIVQLRLDLINAKTDLLEDLKTFLTTFKHSLIKLVLVNLKFTNTAGWAATVQ